MEADIKKCYDHAQRLSAVEESSKSAHKRIDEMTALQESVRELASSTSVMASELASVKEVTDKLDSKITNLELQPAKRWEALVLQVIQLLIAGAVGYFISLLR